MKPILFSTPMVKAILDGTKIMTRRVVKPQPDNDDPSIHYVDREGYLTVPGNESEIWYQMENGDNSKSKINRDDILWVRETWCKLWKLDDNEQIIEGTEKYYYRADGENPTPFNHFHNGEKYELERDCPKWKPSIFMPKEAARIFLKVKYVRLEKLSQITETDAKKEGITDGGCLNCGNSSYPNPCGCNNPEPDYVDTFYWLWNSLNEKRGYGTIVDPWVWVYEFERIKK